MAVNLSPRQLREPDLVDMVMHVVEKTDIPPHSLKLEITESSVMIDPDKCIRKMIQVKERGIQFSIDDFGTGYSYLSYLKRFPIATLKIDRSFITNSLHNRDDQEIIKSIISMAKSLNINIIAEGIETKEQQNLLIELGCISMQGFYFGRPMPGNELEIMLLK